MTLHDDSGRRRPARLRAALLGSAAAVAIAALTVGSVAFSSGGVALQGAPVAHAAEPAAPTAGFADLVARVKPAVISVRVKIEEPANATDQEIPGGEATPFQYFFGPQHPEQQQPRQLIGEGSGFFISADGYAVTNNHVVDHARSVQVTTNDGTIFTAKVVGTDPKTDLALLKVDAHQQFPYVNFANQAPRVGDWVVAVGNPFGLGGTVTAGIVSASGRNIGGNTYDDYLQIDAPINKGNSGGPAFDLSGDVIGVNTAIYSPSGGSVGIGFDIPANTVKTVVDQLKAKGYVTRGWLGVQVQPVTAAIADSLGMKKAEGALVDQAEANSPAANAGLKAGDVITAVNGQPVKDARTLAQKVAMQPPGSKAQLSVVREGQNKTIELTLAEMPKQQQASAQAPEHQQPSATAGLGLRLAPASEVEGSGQKGVVVLSVDPNGPAAQQGVQKGDVILGVAGKPVENPGDVRNALDQTRSAGRHSLLMQVKTAQGTRFVAVPLTQG